MRRPAIGQCICISCDMGDIGERAELGPETSKDLEGYRKLRMRNVILNVTATNPTIDRKMLPIGENQNMTLMSMYYIYFTVRNFHGTSFSRIL